jgi:Phosphoribosyltransferase
MPAPSITKTPDFIAQMDELRSLIGHFSGPAPLPPETPVRDWLARTRGVLAKQPIFHPRLAIYAGPSGTNTSAQTAHHNIIMSNINLADGVLGTLCQMANADLRVYDLSAAPAIMTPENLVRAMSYGMMVIEPGVDFMMATATSAGLDAAIARLLKTADTDPLTLLLEHGSQELAALMGAVLAAKLANKPMVLEGLSGLVVAELLNRANPGAVGHVLLVLPTGYVHPMPLPCPTIYDAIDPDVPGLALIQFFKSLS